MCTLVQVYHRLRIVKGIGACPLWPAMNEARELNVAEPSGTGVPQPESISSMTESE